MVIYLLPDAHGKLEPAVERSAAAAMTLWQQGLLFKAMTGSFLLHTFVSFYFLAGTVLKMLRVASVERRKEGKEKKPEDRDACRVRAQNQFRCHQ